LGGSSGKDEFDGAHQPEKREGKFLETGSLRFREEMPRRYRKKLEEKIERRALISHFKQRQEKEKRNPSFLGDPKGSRISAKERGGLEKYAVEYNGGESKPAFCPTKGRARPPKREMKGKLMSPKAGIPDGQRGGITHIPRH